LPATNNLVVKSH